MCIHPHHITELRQKIWTFLLAEVTCLQPHVKQFLTTELQLDKQRTELMTNDEPIMAEKMPMAELANPQIKSFQNGLALEKAFIESCTTNKAYCRYQKHCISFESECTVTFFELNRHCLRYRFPAVHVNVQQQTVNILVSMSDS